MGLYDTRMGRILGVGPGGKLRAHALAGNDGVRTLDHGAEAARDVPNVEHGDNHHRVHDGAAWNVHQSRRTRAVGAFVRSVVHGMAVPRVHGDYYDRGNRGVHMEVGHAQEPGQAGIAAVAGERVPGAKRPVPDGGVRHAVGNHIPHILGSGERHGGNGRPAFLQPRERARASDNCDADGGGADAALAQGSIAKHPSHAAIPGSGRAYRGNRTVRDGHNPPGRAGRVYDVRDGNGGHSARVDKRDGHAPQARRGRITRRS